MAVFSSACGSDSTTEPDAVTIADLVGTWKATSVLFTNQANPAQQFDIVVAGGELRSTVLNHGGARTWIEFGDFSDEWDAQLSVSGSQLTSTPVEVTRPTRRYTIEMDGNRLTMTSSDASFDFTLTGATAVPATEVIVYVRH
jgi:hypothetical protein